MLRITKILSSLSAGLFLSLSGLLMGSAHAAGSASMYLSPASGSVLNGNALTFDIHENSGSDTVNGVQANLTYPSSMFSFGSITSSGAFGIAAQSDGSTAGTIKIGRGASPAVSGDQIVATVQLIATAGSGSATISFGSGTALVNSVDNQNESLTLSTGNYTLASPPSGGSGSGSSTTSSGSSSSSSSSSTKSSSTKASSGTTSTSSPAVSAASTSAVTVSGVTVSNVTASSATVKWQTSAPTTSQVNYGLDNKYGYSSSDPAMATSHVLVLSQFLTDGTLYHFAVSGTDASGKTVNGQDSTFRTQGSTLIITVIDQHNKAVKGASVTVSGVTATTDASGKASLNELPTGDIKVAVFYNGTTTNTNLKIGSASQTYTVKITVPASKTGLIVPIVIIAAALVLLSVARVLVVRQREQSKEMSRHFPKLPGNDKTPGASSSVTGPKVIVPGGSSTPTPTATPTSPGSTIQPNSKPKE